MPQNNGAPTSQDYSNIASEILLKIFSNLSRRDLYRTLLVCKHWNNVGLDNSLWKEHAKEYLVKVYDLCNFSNLATMQNARLLLKNSIFSANYRKSQQAKLDEQAENLRKEIAKISANKHEFLNDCTTDISSDDNLMDIGSCTVRFSKGILKLFQFFMYLYYEKKESQLISELALLQNKRSDSMSKPEKNTLEQSLKLAFK